VSRTSAARANAGTVLVLHGGQSVSTAPTSPAQLAVLRTVPLARAVRRAVGPAGVQVRRPRFTVRGWNGPCASPVADVASWLDAAAGPVVLIGHSMGARAALRAAGHPRVVAVAGLAPWLPPGEPVAQLAGRAVLLAHGGRDRVTSPAETWAFAELARAVTQVTTVSVAGGDHAMLAHARGWHRLAADFAAAAFRLAAGQPGQGHRPGRGHRPGQGPRPGGSPRTRSRGPRRS
jgi:pimeloyl-ACP methyl ester carboxylesterase